MVILYMDWFGLILTGLGTLFLFGELLVNMKEFFGLLGISFMTVYFTIPGYGLIHCDAYYILCWNMTVGSRWQSFE